MSRPVPHRPAARRRGAEHRHVPRPGRPAGILSRLGTAKRRAREEICGPAVAAFYRERECYDVIESVIVASVSLVWWIVPCPRAFW
jgi:hypothetical protein